MTTIKINFTLIVLLFFASACTKVIDVKLGNDTGKLDIEANVTNINGLQTIKLTTNVPFTNTNTYPPVSGATVTIADQQGNSYPFIESPAGIYTNSQLTGNAGGTYKMTVLTGKATYNASSVMPTQVLMDSITSKNRPVPSSTTKKEISVHYSDPVGVPNQYRFVLFVNGVQAKVVFAFDDEFNDGKTVSLNLRQDDIDIYAGDKVTVEMQCIDKPVYLYWFTLSQQENSGPGGSVAPSDPPTNISPVALGYFSAHTTQTKSIVVK